MNVEPKMKKMQNTALSVVHHLKTVMIVMKDIVTAMTTDIVKENECFGLANGGMIVGILFGVLFNPIWCFNILWILLFGDIYGPQ